MRQPLKSSLITLLVVGLVGVCWHGGLDRHAEQATEKTFNRALATFAVARTLNGVISVAQGTEIAITPVGVGVALKVGEILDPLNDLIERFSWLLLIASASLGTQILLTQIFSEVWLNALVTVTSIAFLTSLWAWPAGKAHGLITRVALITLFTRFTVVATALLTTWVDAAFLEPRQTQAETQITTTTRQIESMREDPQADPELLDQLSSWMDSGRQALDVRAQVNRLKLRAESTIGEIINLIVVFFVQTVLVPVAVLMLL
ncbi:MAG: hypothetical protein O3A63_20430, partial [Proteobacteria bacterium]|nr:hypothetical protein [Pseudomonadota bacterium]